MHAQFTYFKTSRRYSLMLLFILLRHNNSFHSRSTCYVSIGWRVVEQFLHQELLAQRRLTWWITAEICFLLQGCHHVRMNYFCSQNIQFGHLYKSNKNGQSSIFNLYFHIKNTQTSRNIKTTKKQNMEEKTGRPMRPDDCPSLKRKNSYKTSK